LGVYRREGKCFEDKEVGNEKKRKEKKKKKEQSHTLHKSSIFLC
jgi:hypothetical protein